MSTRMKVSNWRSVISARFRPDRSPRPLTSSSRHKSRKAVVVVEEKFGTLPGIAHRIPRRLRRLTPGVVCGCDARSSAAWRPSRLSLSPPCARAADRGGRRGRHSLSRRRPVRLQRADAHGDAHACTSQSIPRTKRSRRTTRVLDEMKQKGMTAEELGSGSKSEVSVKLFFDVGGRTRRVDSAVRADAPSGLLHAV